MRLAKVAEHTTLILDVADDSGESVEYDPFRPDERWTGQLDCVGSDELMLEVGPYKLHATRKAHTAGSYFSGVESGPYGEHEFDLIALDTNPSRLTSLSSSRWLAFRSGQFTPFRFAAGVIETYPRRPKGVADVCFPPALCEPDGKPYVVTAHGIRGGETTAIKVSSWPCLDRPNDRLRIDEDSNERMAKFTWYGVGDLVADAVDIAFRGRNYILYPITDFPEGADSS